MTISYQPTLRDRLVSKHGTGRTTVELPEIPATGLIPAGAMAVIDAVARNAHAGDMQARDRLYMALRPRLLRKGHILRPWPNTPRLTGIWDRDDVQQEGWLVFAELLATWDGSKPFVPYLLSRFPWRLRDRILRGIGKPLPRIGELRVPEDLLGEILLAHDSDQPESALLAHRLLVQLLQSIMKAQHDSLDAHAVLTILRSPQFGTSRPEVGVADDDHPFTQMESA